MYIERIDGQRGLFLRKTIEINVGNNEARGATIGVLKDPLKIALKGNGGASEAVENRDLLGLKTTAIIISISNMLKKRR